MANYESIPGPIEATDMSERVAITPALTPEQTAEFTAFYSSAYKEMLGVAHGMQSRDPEAAVQTAFMNAMRHWGNYRETGSTRTAWVSTMVRRNVISEYRSSSRYQIVDGGSDSHAFLSIPDRTSESDFGSVNDSSLIDSALDTVAAVLTDKEIKDNWLEIFKLYALSDLSQDEIAEKLDVPNGTVRSRIFRLKKRLTSNALLHDMLAPNDTVDA